MERFPHLDLDFLKRINPLTNKRGMRLSVPSLLPAATGGRQQQREHGGGGEIQPAEAEGPSPPAAGPIWSREGLAHRLHSLLRGSRGLVEGWVMPDEGVLSRQAEVRMSPQELGSDIHYIHSHTTQVMGTLHLGGDCCARLVFSRGAVLMRCWPRECLLDAASRC